MIPSALKKFTTKSRDADATARAFARCFATPDGKIVLEHLHHQILFRVVDPNINDDALRFLEGQRQFLLWICQMIAKGHTPT